MVIGEKTDGYPNECLMAPIEWTNCLRATKPFADNSRLLAEAEKQWKQHCHETLLARYPDADETYDEIRATENRDFVAGAALFIVAAIVIVAAILATIWFAWAFTGVIIPLALLIIALHFLGCF
jgi:hypothetical protein